MSQMKDVRDLLKLAIDKMPDKALDFKKIAPNKMVAKLNLKISEGPNPPAIVITVNVNTENNKIGFTREDKSRVVYAEDFKIDDTQESLGLDGKPEKGDKAGKDGAGEK